MKRFISFFLVFSVLVSTFSFSAFADTLPFVAGGGYSRGGGAGRDLPSTPKSYYTQQDNSLQVSGSGSGSGIISSSLTVSTTYLNSGVISRYSIQDKTSNTLNYTANNKNYSYTYNSYSYNDEYNYYTYNIDNRKYYVVNNYTYYSIYIPSDTYENEYERVDLYYQLPDGRNSWDLTADEVWGTYFVYDSVNYDKVVEDDGVTLALYHLDGNFEDSSYYHRSPIKYGLNDFVDTPFSSGLELSAVSVYTRYRFSVPLSDDMRTIEFRVKVSSSYFKSGVSGQFSQSTCNLCFGPSDTPYSYYPIPTGCWVSVAFVRDGESSEGSCFYVYLNGIKTDYVAYPVRTDGGFEFYFCNSDSYYSTYCSAVPSSVIYDEIRISNKSLYDSDYVPRSQPFDTNLVTVLPSEGYEGLVAIKSDSPVHGIRVGGVRPTFPSDGDVYVFLDNDIVKGVQQYQRDGWYAVDGAIFTDGDWVNISGYDMKGYSVSYLPSGGSDSDSTGSGSGSNGSGDSSNVNVSGLGSLISSLFGGITDVFSGVLGGLVDLFSSVLKVAGGFTDFLSAGFAFLPADVVSVLGAGVVLMVILAIIKFIRG